MKSGHLLHIFNVFILGEGQKKNRKEERKGMEGR